MRGSTQKFKSCIIQLLVALTCLSLIALYCAGLLAPYHYYFDLLGHFVIQYMMAAVLLCAFALLCRQKKWALVMFALALICFGHSRFAMHDPYQLIAPSISQSGLTIASWNQNIHNMSMDNMAGLFFTEGAPPDVIIVLEANRHTLKMADNMLERYPHQIEGITRTLRPTSFLIMSRIPIIDHRTIKLFFYNWMNEAVRFQVQPLTSSEPYTIYAIHTHSPNREDHQKRRLYELKKLAATIKEDKSKHIILAGDLNTTPYIPAFRDFLASTGLHYQSYGFFLNPSWPVLAKFPALQIPIDHMLYSDGLRQDSKNTITLNGSDHLALIAGFSEQNE